MFFVFFSSTSLLLPTHLHPPSCTLPQSCNPMDCSLPGSSVHGLFQAIIPEWVTISFSVGLVLVGWAMLSKSLIQFSIDGRGCVLFLLFDLRPNSDGGHEDHGHLLQKLPCRHCCTLCPQSCSRPPPTHASTRGSWTLTGKSGSVSCGVTDPFSWVLMHTSFCLCPQRVYFSSPM